MDETLDDQLETEAARLGVSKASLIREAVARVYAIPPEDPIDEFVGRFDGEPTDVPIDAIIYR